VGTHFSRSHALAWERIFLVPTRWRGNAFSLLQQNGQQARKYGTLAHPEPVPTPARGNQKIKTGRWRVPNRFPRRRVNAIKLSLGIQTFRFGSV